MLPLLISRLSVAAICVAVILYSFHPSARKIASLLSGGALVIIGLMIVVMIHLHDMLEPDKSPSNYYAGLMLVTTAATLLCTWTKKTGITVFSILYLSYLVPTLVLQPPASPILYLSNNTFLLSTIFVSLVGHHFNYNLMMREFFASNELAEANDDLEEAYDKLKELDRYRSQFFSNITHELKTPLTLILAPTEAVIRGELSGYTPSQQDFFKRIYQNGLRLMKLINDLLDLAKLEDSKLRLRVQEIGVEDFVKGLASNIRPLAERKNIVLEAKSLDNPVKIWADRDRLEQVFINLLANAVKFTPERGSIIISVTQDHEYLQLCVADTGIGIPEDKLELVFDRFQQVDGTSTRKYGGTGIGLALARELTNLHGGSIWAESEFGKGTRMTVQLRMGHAHFDPTILDRRQTEEAVSHGRRNDDTGMPQWSARFEMQNEYKYQAIDEATERRLAPRDHGIAAEEAQARILVVEDSRDMLQFIHLQLTDAYTVYLAEHGKRGLELVRKLKPDLVVTDYMMPEMDGIELTKFIKEDRTTAHIPVVMLTAKAGVQDRVAGREAGADEYLAKPFRTSELMAVIKAQLKASENEADRIVSHRMDSVEILAGRLAHEIHNPLNYLKNGAFLIGRSVDRLNEAYSDQDTKKQEKAVTSIHRLIEQINVGAERISGTVDMLKEYAREGYSPEIREYSVNDGIRAVMDVVRPTDGILRDIIFTPDDTAGSLQCVPQEFHEIVSNLIQNAMDATMDDAQISVRAVDDEDRVLIEVQDNGSGMPPEVVEKVFSPFFTTKEPGRGMGMGLTIVYRLVKRAGGRIDVFSEEGEGTRFSVRLPRQQNTGSA